MSMVFFHFCLTSRQKNKDAPLKSNFHIYIHISLEINHSGLNSDKNAGAFNIMDLENLNLLPIPLRHQLYNLLGNYNILSLKILHLFFYI